MKLLNLFEEMCTNAGGASVQTGSGEQHTGKTAFKKRKASLKEKKPLKKPSPTMNIQELYNQVINEHINKATFLENVRRNPLCKNFITNVSNYEDTIQQLKSRGYIQEAKQELNEDFNFWAATQEFSKAAKKKPTRDSINDYEFQKGWRYEYEQMKTPDVEKAQEKAIKNIAGDAIYYTRLITGEKKNGRTDQMIPMKKDNFVDKANEMKKAKKAKEYKADAKGKSEMKRGKPKGVKTMKGGSGEMKAVNENAGQAQQPAQKDVSFTVEDLADKNKKVQVKKTIQSIKKGKEGKFNVLFTTKERLEVSKDSKGEIAGKYFGDAANPTAGEEVIDLGKNLEMIVQKLFPQEEQSDDNIKEMSVDDKGNLNGASSNIKDIGFSSIRKDYGGGIMISAKVDGEKRIAKLSKEDAQKHWTMKADDRLQLATRYLVQNFDEKVDKFLKGKADERNKVAQANKAYNGKLNEADLQLEENLRILIRERIKTLIG